MNTHPPQTARSAARRAASPASKGVFGGGESEPAGLRMETGRADGGADTCPPPRRPRQQLLPRRGRTPAAGQPDTRPGGGLGPAAASGFTAPISPGAKPRGGLLRAAARSGSPRRPAGRAERGAGGRQRPGLRGAGGSAPPPLGRGAWSGGAGRARQARPAGPSSGSGARRRAEAADPTHSLTHRSRSRCPSWRWLRSPWPGRDGGGREGCRAAAAGGDGTGLGWRGGGGGWLPRPRAGSLCLRPPRRRRRALCPLPHPDTRRK